MILNCRVSLHTFVEGFSATSGGGSFFTVPAVGLMHLVPQEEIDYALSLLREAICEYEREKGIPVSESKKEMPFFRQDSRMLIGPEVGMYVIPMYERLTERPLADEPSLILSLDYQRLGEICLFENYSLSTCKYEKEAVIRHFVSQLEREYDKFFFDEENFGFTANSRFFSLLCNACLEVKKEVPGVDKEWRLAVLRDTEDVRYTYHCGQLIPYIPIEIPVECLKQIYLENYKSQPLLYGTLNGFLKSKGLPAEQLLNLQ